VSDPKATTRSSGSGRLRVSSALACSPSVARASAESPDALSFRLHGGSCVALNHLTAPASMTATGVDGPGRGYGDGEARRIRAERQPRSHNRLRMPIIARLRSRVVMIDQISFRSVHAVLIMRHRPHGRRTSALEFGAELVECLGDLP